MNDILQQYNAHMNSSATPGGGMMGSGIIFLFVCGLGLLLGAAWMFKRR